MAPEIFKNRPQYNKEIEKYSLGVVLHLMLNNGKSKYKGMEEIDQHDLISLSKKSSNIEYTNIDVSAEAKDLVFNLL